MMETTMVIFCFLIFLLNPSELFAEQQARTYPSLTDVPLGGWCYLYAPEEVQDLCEIRANWTYAIRDDRLECLKESSEYLQAMSKVKSKSAEFQRNYVDDALSAYSNESRHLFQSKADTHSN